MIDVIAGAAVIVGALLALLGSVGLLFFPDVFTRMHAASKAASLGVILATMAAALEADTFGAVALLVLVTALLFLSAPLGTSLLARAAYTSPSTPRLLPDRDDLGGISIHPAGGTEEQPGAMSLLVGWLFVVWVALFASGTAGVLAGAVMVGIVVALALPDYRPRWPRGIFKPVAAIRFAFAFVSAVVAANIDVAAAVISRRPLRPAIVGVPLRVRTATETALLMNVLTFTPGTVAVDLIDNELFLHVLDLRDEELFLRRFAEIEDRIIDAFGTKGERSGRLPQ